MLSLERDEIHLWHAHQDDFDTPSLQAQCLDWLSEAERQRYERFYLDRVCQRFLLGRLLIRSSLSRYRDIAPEAWRFVENAQGKPAIDPALGQGDLYFNLSHSGSRLVLAVGAMEQLGVDIEASARPRRVRRIARRFFSAAEAAALLALPEAQQLDRFYLLWTLKEAYIKARGLGLLLPLHQFSFSFPGADDVAVSFTEELGDQPERWQFWQLAWRDDSALALAAAGPVRRLVSHRLCDVARYEQVETVVLRS